MNYRVLLLLLSFIKIDLVAQNIFPIDGVAKEFSPIYAFINANIIDGEKEIINGTVLVQGKKFIAVDSSLKIPEGAIIRDLDGKFMYPSFIDLNTQYGLPNNKKREFSYKPQYESKKDGAYHWNQAIHPEFNAITKFTNDNTKAESLREMGFGTVLTHKQDGIARGVAGLVLLSNEKEHENIIIEKASAHFSFKKGSSNQRYPTSLMGSIALLKQTLLDAEWYSQGGSDFNFSYEALLQQRKLPQIFSIDEAFDVSRVYKIADEFEIDYIIIGNGDEYKQLDIIKKSNFSFVLPINFPNSYDVSNPEEAEYITLKALKHWETAPFNPYILSKNNIPFSISCFGQENANDFITNLRHIVKKGLSKKKALASLTTIPARQINAEKMIGTIQKDKYANFIICSKDIFEDGVIYENWIAGKKFEIKKEPKIDIRGYYTIKSDKFNGENVVIEGSINKPEVIISILDSLPLNSNLSGKDITINTKDGKFSAIGSFSNNSILGRFQDENGFFQKLSIIRDSLLKEVKKDFILEIDSVIPKLWSPNKAYGFKKNPLVETILFENATIWTNEKDGILENSSLLIKNSKIIAVDTEIQVSDFIKKNEAFKVIDASGKHITCGIIDEHSHIAIRKGVNESSQSVTAEVKIGDVINSNDINIYRQLAGGVTTAQLLHGSANPIGGQSAIIKLRWGSNAEDMKIKNTDPFIKFALGENVKQSNWGDFNKIRFPQSRMGVEQVFYDAFYRAKKYKLEWDLYNAMPFSMKRKTKAPREDLELNALVKILENELFITCHSYVQSEINMLMHVADSMGFIVNTFTHILEGYKIADKMKRHGAGGSTFSDWWAYKFEVNDAIPHNATILNNAGVTTAINSDDAEMGRRLNQEAAKAIKYGGTNEEDAWKMVTLNPAKLLHLENRIGSIRVGKDADIVLWSDNPLSVYTQVEQTYIDGVCLYDSKRDLKLRKQNLQERIRIIKKMVNSKDIKKQKPKKEKLKLYKCCQH